MEHTNLLKYLNPTLPDFVMIKFDDKLCTQKNIIDDYTIFITETLFIERQ